MPPPIGSISGNYLGDGVRISHDGWALVLTTDDGVEVTNRVVLEPEVYANLIRYVEHLPPARRPLPDYEKKKQGS